MKQSKSYLMKELKCTLFTKNIVGKNYIYYIDPKRGWTKFFIHLNFNYKLDINVI